jgi:hypothetical protein
MFLQRGQGQSHNFNVLIRVLLGHPVVACVAAHG